MYKDIGVDEAAKRAGLHKRYLYEALRSGNIEGAYKDGNAWRIPPASLEAWISGGGERTAAPRRGLFLRPAISDLLTTLAEDQGESPEDLLYRLLDVEVERRGTRAQTPARLIEIERLKSLLDGRPLYELDYTVENYLGLPPQSGSHELQMLLRDEREDLGATRLGYVRQALAGYTGPSTGCLDLAMASTEWTFARLREEINALRGADRDKTLGEYLKPSIADLEPSEVDLRRHLACLPLPGDRALRTVAVDLLALHPSARGLRVSEHERSVPDASVFGVTPWEVGRATDFIVSSRPTYTIEAFRLSTTSTIRGGISAHVVGPDSIREVGDWSKRELFEHGRPRRVTVENGTVLSCFDRLIFETPKGLGPNDHIEVWAHPATAWEQRTTKNLAPMKPRPLES